jgi:hypothetical protein
MSKYDPLTEHLKAARGTRVPMSFAELERVLGFPLPPSSRKHRAWWANNPGNHVNAQAWHQAGYQSSDVDLAAQKLVFVRLNAVGPRTPAKGDHPLWGVLSGIVTVAPGVDLTEPMYTDEEIDAFTDYTADLISGRGR